MYDTPKAYDIIGARKKNKVKMESPQIILASSQSESTEPLISEVPEDDSKSHDENNSDQSIENENLTNKMLSARIQLLLKGNIQGSQMDLIRSPVRRRRATLKIGRAHV